MQRAKTTLKRNSKATVLSYQMTILPSVLSNEDRVEPVKKGEMEHRIKPVHLRSPDCDIGNKANAKEIRVVFSIKT